MERKARFEHCTNKGTNSDRICERGCCNIWSPGNTSDIDVDTTYEERLANVNLIFE